MTIPVSMVSTFFFFIHIRIVGGSPLVRGLVRPSYKLILLLLTLLVNGDSILQHTYDSCGDPPKKNPLITYILAELH